MKKVCGRCKLNKFVDLFSLQQSKPDGHQAWCKTCIKAYDSERFQRIKPERMAQVTLLKKEMTAWVRGLKVEPCSDCGQSFHPVCMDFDHIVDGKVASVSNLLRLGYGKDKILEEIEKCELVCANCHRFRTFKRRGMV